MGVVDIVNHGLMHAVPYERTEYPALASHLKNVLGRDHPIIPVTEEGLRHGMKAGEQALEKFRKNFGRFQLYPYWDGVASDVAVNGQALLLRKGIFIGKFRNLVGKESDVIASQLHDALVVHERIHLILTEEVNLLFASRMRLDQEIARFQTPRASRQLSPLAEFFVRQTNVRIGSLVIRAMEMSHEAKNHIAESFPDGKQAEWPLHGDYFENRAGELKEEGKTLIGSQGPLRGLQADIRAGRKGYADVIRRCLNESLHAQFGRAMMAKGRVDINIRVCQKLDVFRRGLPPIAAGALLVFGLAYLFMPRSHSQA